MALTLNSEDLDAIRAIIQEEEGPVAGGFDPADVPVLSTVNQTVSSDRVDSTVRLDHRGVIAAPFSISASAPNATVVGSLTSGVASPKVFTILSGNSDNIFAVDANGQITVADNTNLSAAVYTLAIKMVGVVAGVEKFFVATVTAS